MAPDERFAEPAELLNRRVPGRKLLAVIRIAATLATPEVESAAFHRGAITVIRGVPVDDLATVRETIKDVFPARWTIIDPDLIEGQVAKTTQSRFTRSVNEHMDGTEPLMILQTDGIVLPQALRIAVPEPFDLAPITHDILMIFLRAGHLAEQVSEAGNLRAALPSEAELSDLSTVDICAALRGPMLHDAVDRLGKIAYRNVNVAGPRLEDMNGESAALNAARRIVADLQAWKAGAAEWHEISHSMLLYGAPGTGKSWLAKAIANSAGFNLVTGNFGQWQSAGHLGDMLRELTATFAEARRKSPCVLIIDESDAVGSRIDPERHASNYRTQVITTVLTELDRISHEPGVIVVATCNHFDRIDPAAIRPGRMDLKIEVHLPDADAILEILRFHLSSDIAEHDLRSLSRRAAGKTAADIDAAIRAARSDARHARKMLSVGMLEAKLNIRPDDENRDRTWRVAIHEAGHAVVAKALKIGELSSIMITRDGGNVACRIYQNECRLSDIENEIAYSMAGRAAERLVLGEISAGAGGPAYSDLALATGRAIAIETTYGLGIQGPIWHQGSDSAHLAVPAIRDRVLQRITRAETRAGKILRQNRHYVELLARHLVEHRTIKRQTIARLLDGVTSNLADLSLENIPP